MSLISCKPLRALVIVLLCALVAAPLAAWRPPRAEAAADTRGYKAEATMEECEVWFLAEGYTGGDFDTWVLVQNPGEVDSEVTLKFQLPPGASAGDYVFDLPAGTRQSIHLDELPGLEATDVSTTVVATEPVVAERAMYFNYNGKPGGHDSVGIKYPASLWYLAEGYTGGDFDTWVLVQNPGAADTTVTLDFQLPPGASAEPYTFDLPGGTRRSIHLDELPGLEATDVSTRVSSPIPVVAERAMYFNYDNRITGGSDSCGLSTSSDRWFLAEGYTGGDFDTWVLVQNPGTTDTTVTLDFQLPPGNSADPYAFNLPAGTRQSVHLDDLPGLGATDVSTTVTATKPVVAERAMYFNYEGRVDGHDSIGASDPQCDWYLAEGYTGGEFDTWVLVQNPGETEKTVTLHFQLPPGSAADDYTFKLPAGTRQSVHLDLLPGLESTDVSTWVDSDGPVVVERAEYFNYEGKGGGHCSIGALYESVLIYSTTKVLEAGDTQYLVSDDIPADGKRVLVFSQTTPNLSNVERGDVVVFGPCALVPGGLMGRVDELSTGGTVVMTLGPAGLEEAIVRGRINSAGAAAAAAAGYKDINPFPLHFEDTITANTSVGSAPNYIDITGSVHVDFTMDFAIDIDCQLPDFDWVAHKGWFGVTYYTLDVTPPSVELKSMSFGASFTEDIAVDITTHGDLTISEREDIPGTEVFLPETGINFAIGPVPVSLWPYVKLIVGVDGQVHADLTAGVTQHGGFSAGVAYDSGTGWGDPTSSSEFSYEFRTPNDDNSFVQSSIQVGIGPQIGILFYHVAGPYINVLPGLKLTLDTDAGHPGNMLWAIYITFDVELGVQVGLEIEDPFDWGFEWSFELLDESWTVFEEDWLLVNKVVIYSLTPTEGSAGDEVTVDGWGFGGSRQNDSRVLFASTRAPDGGYTKWTNTQIKCKVPTGVGGTVTVKVTRIFHRWDIGGVAITISKNSNGLPFTVTGGGTGGAGTWDPQTSGTTEHVYGVSALAANDVWAVTTAGSALHYNGSAWSSQATGTTLLYDISAAASNRVWAVGYQGRIRYYNGSYWADQAIATTNDFHGVYALDPTHVWAVGEGGMIYFNNGSGWSSQSSGITEDLHSVMAVDASNVWAVGNNGTVLFNGGGGWGQVAGAPANSQVDVWTLGVDNIISLCINLNFYDSGVWTTEYSGLSEGLECVAALSASRVWAGGWYGSIRFWDGSDWTPQSVADAGVDIQDIDILDSTHMWAVGTDGTILFNDGT